MTTPAAPKVLEDLTEEEKYLFAIMQDTSGLDIAEFLWYDSRSPSGCFRAWPFQWKWWRTSHPMQIDQCLAQGTLILTERGQVPIEDVELGDRVATHTGSWEKVEHVWDRGVRPVVRIVGEGFDVKLTSDHRVHTFSDHSDHVFDKAAVGQLVAVRNDDGSPLWLPIENLVEAGEERVYDLEVTADHSFVAGGLMVSNCARSMGKSLSIKVRGFAFPFIFPGEEMVITAPELVHLEPIVSLVEEQFFNNRLGREMVQKGRSGVTHRPFQMNFSNGSRIIGRIPQRDGKGVKGCEIAGTAIWTSEGYKNVEDLVVGDLVWTHRNRWMPIQAIETDINDVYEVRGAGSFPMTVSCDHRFYGVENQAGPKQTRDFTGLGWHDVEELLESKVYWATPTKFQSEPVPGVDGLAQSDEFWWLVGRWLADGSLACAGSPNGRRRVLWCVPEHKVDAVLEALAAVHVPLSSQGKRSHSSADMMSILNNAWHDWLEEHFGRLAGGKKLPPFVLGMPEAHRRQLLQGYLDGDGFWSEKKNRWEVSSASKELVMGVQLLAQTLGYTVGCTQVQPKTTEIAGVKLKSKPQMAWRLHIGQGHSVQVGDYLVGKVKSVESLGKQTVYNPIVEEDHSYMTGTIMSHNIHPIWLELDEAQDYPEQGWTELTETLKRGVDGATWRAHGVTRGIRDKFYEHTQDTPDNQWKVHRYPAMARPNWSDQERAEKIKQYGSREDPDYRRNVLGLHGDSTNPMFVLHRLMSCVDDDPHSTYNENEYFQVTIKGEDLERDDFNVDDVLDFPTMHLAGKGKKTYWCGMDIGLTIDPSEILVFCETQGKDGDDSQLKLLARIEMHRVGSPDQTDIMRKVMNFYRPRAFGLDKGGLGLPMFQQMQRDSENDSDIRWMLDVMKGYNFAEKHVVDFDQTVEVSEFADMDEVVRESGLRRNLKEYGSDMLRELVDNRRLQLPWDKDLLKQFQGGTWTNAKGMQDQYGRRLYSKGNDHILDAARFFALAWSKNKIEETLARESQQPILDSFIQF